jgi:hypothetical protein
LKEAGVLLIAAVLILTAIFVFTPITKLARASPLSINWIHYDDGNAAAAIGLTCDGTFQFAIRLTETELLGYDDLTTVKFVAYDNPNQPTLHGFIYIYGPGPTDTAPGARIDTATTPWEQTGMGWIEITLTNPVHIIHPSQDLWVSVECVNQPANTRPAGADCGPAIDKKGDWIYIDGILDWTEIQIFGFDFNWNLWAGVESANNPPYADAGPDQTLEQTSRTGAEVTLDGLGSYDPDGDSLNYDWTWAGGSTTGVSPTVTLPLGTTTVTLTVNDGALTASDTVNIKVEDTTPPDITLSGNQIILRPPNNKYQTIRISDFVLSVTDICDANVGIDDVIITSVSSDEPENAKGDVDGNTRNDIVILNAQTVKLRAERNEKANGRVYTINFKVTDLSGNTATECCKIWVLKSQAPRWRIAIDDGASAGYTVYYP